MLVLITCEKKGKMSRYQQLKQKTSENFNYVTKSILKADLGQTLKMKIISLHLKWYPKSYMLVINIQPRSHEFTMSTKKRECYFEPQQC